MSKKHGDKGDSKGKKKKKSDDATLPVLASDATGGERTDAAHATNDAHAQLIDHNYLEEQQFGTVAETLQRNLANTIAMYFKLKKFHWDIRGRMFVTLHELYDKQAEEVFENIDVLAERLVMLGGSPIAAPVEVDRFATIRVPTQTIHDAREQLEQLVADHTVISRALRDDSQAVDDAGDPATADIYNGILHTMDMHRWMLQALLDDQKVD